MAETKVVVVDEVILSHGFGEMLIISLRSPIEHQEFESSALPIACWNADVLPASL